MVNNLLQKKKESRKELTDKQLLFVDALLENGGNVNSAMELAEYSPQSKGWLLKSVRNEIIDRTEHLLAINAVKAASRIVSTIDDDGTTPRAEIKLKAAETLLNRVGLGRKDTVEHNVTALHGVILLPSKGKQKEPLIINQDG